MTTSGTTAFTLDFISSIEEAYERCGLEVRHGWEAKSARISANLLLQEWANRGINLWTVEERSLALTIDVPSYALGADIVDLIEYMIVVPNQAQETRYALTRVSVSQQATRTNPTLTGRPTEIYINRLRDGPTVHLWPIPDQAGYSLAYWVLRRIEDVGAYTNTADMPFRFGPAFVAGLAFHIARKKRFDNPELVSRLQGDYEMEFQRAADEDREKATLMMSPRASSYRINR